VAWRINARYGGALPGSLLAAFFSPLLPSPLFLTFSLSCACFILKGQVMASKISPPLPPAPCSHDVQNSSVPSISSEPTPVTNPCNSPLPSESSSVRNGREGDNHEMTASNSPLSGFAEYFSEEVAGAHTSVYLLISFFTSGLIDSVAFMQGAASLACGRVGQMAIFLLEAGLTLVPRAR